MNKTRRHLIKLAVAATGLVSLVSKAFSAEVLQGTDPQAISLGYKADTTKIDTLRWTNYRAGNSCSNCAFYQGNGSATGSCKIFGGKIVSAEGWCSVYRRY